MNTSPKIFVVIPAHNEATTIFFVVASVKRVIPNVIVVDDSSGDETATLAKQAGAEVLSHIINRGQGAALKTGIDYALLCGADVIVTFDADGQHKPEEILSMIEPVVRGEADVALGSRFLNGNSNTIPFIRRLVLRGGILFTKIFSRIRVTDTHNGFRALSKKAAETIRIRQDRMAHASEILDEIAYHGLKFREIPVTITYSAYSMQKGQSSLNSIKIALKFLLNKLIQ
ncbi:MAG TPA: glycosyltransferase family 2 protein [Patescibacteria group bacterium]|nr:glycosyltransferase family 2 protein [Patescibacteria group bacterium]